MVAVITKDDSFKKRTNISKYANDAKPNVLHDCGLQEEDGTCCIWVDEANIQYITRTDMNIFLTDTTTVCLVFVIPAPEVPYPQAAP